MKVVSRLSIYIFAFIVMINSVSAVPAAFERIFQIFSFEFLQNPTYAVGFLRLTFFIFVMVLLEVAMIPFFSLRKFEGQTKNAAKYKHILAMVMASWSFFLPIEILASQLSFALLLFGLLFPTAFLAGALALAYWFLGREASWGRVAARIGIFLTAITLLAAYNAGTYLPASIPGLGVGFNNAGYIEIVSWYEAILALLILVELFRASAPGGMEALKSLAKGEGRSKKKKGDDGSDGGSGGDGSKKKDDDEVRKKLEEVIEILKDESKSKDVKITELKEKIERIKVLFKEANKKKREFRESFEEVLGREAEALKDLEQLSNEFSVLQNLLDDKEIRVDQLEQQLKKAEDLLKDETKKSKNLLHNLLEAVDKIREIRIKKAEALKEEAILNVEFKAKIKDLEKQIAWAQKEKSDASSEAQASKQEANDLLHDLNLSDQIIQDLRSKLENAGESTALDDATAKAEAAVDMQEMLLKELEESEKEISRLQKEGQVNQEFADRIIQKVIVEYKKIYAAWEQVKKDLQLVQQVEMQEPNPEQDPITVKINQQEINIEDADRAEDTIDKSIKNLNKQQNRVINELQQQRKMLLNAYKHLNKTLERAINSNKLSKSAKQLNNNLERNFTALMQMLNKEITMYADLENKNFPDEYKMNFDRIAKKLMRERNRIQSMNFQNIIPQLLQSFAQAKPDDKEGFEKLKKNLFNWHNTFMECKRDAEAIPKIAHVSEEQDKAEMQEAA